MCFSGSVPVLCLVDQEVVKYQGDLHALVSSVINIQSYMVLHVVLCFSFRIIVVPCSVR